MQPCSHIHWHILHVQCYLSHCKDTKSCHAAVPAVVCACGRNAPLKSDSLTSLNSPFTTAVPSKSGAGLETTTTEASQSNSLSLGQIHVTATTDSVPCSTAKSARHLAFSRRDTLVLQRMCSTHHCRYFRMQQGSSTASIHTKTLHSTWQTPEQIQCACVFFFFFDRSARAQLLADAGARLCVLHQPYARGERTATSTCTYKLSNYVMWRHHYKCC